MRNLEIEAEQAYITRAHALLEKARLRATRLRSMVEVGRGGTRQALYERDVIEEQVANRLAQLELGPSSLVFGRIDHNDHNADATEATDAEAGQNQNGDSEAEPSNTFYIGRIAVADEQQEPVIVDWRARIAEPFFRASTTEPMGLLRRRHFTTRGAELLDIEDEIFDFDRFFGDDPAPAPTGDAPAGGDTPSAGDTPTSGNTADAHQNPLKLRARGALYAALEERRGPQMRDVVATIQSDQDEIVREPLAGILIVQGGPGTGKTVVALHRAAYLLYSNRFPLADQGLLVIGPNRLFLRYIERVLPSLGEVGAFQYVLADLFNDLFPDVHVTQPDTPAAAAVKGSEKMSQVLANAIALRQRSLKVRLRLPFRAAYLTLTAQQSQQIIAEARKRFSHHNAAARFVENSVFATLAASQPNFAVTATDEDADGNDASRDPVATQNSGVAERAAKRAAKLPAHLQEAAPVDLIRERLSEHPDVIEAIERMWPTLSPAQFLRDLYGSPALLSASAKEILSEQEQAALHRSRGDNEATYEWSDADVPLLDEAYELLGPRRSRSRRGSTDPAVRTFGHIVLDEAQDHSPMSLRMVARRSLNGSMTIVGDIAQTTSPSAIADWDEIVRSLSKTREVESRRRELTLSYRIAKPSLAPAIRVLAASQPDVRPAVPVRTSGPEPMFISAQRDGALLDDAQPSDDCIAAAVQTIRQLVAEQHSVLAVSPPSLIATLEAAMAESGMEFGRATAASRNATGALHQTVTLATVELVKGLETDAVLVVEPAAIVAEEPRGLGALYVALTRATQQVAVVHALPLPPALLHEAVLADGAS